MIDIEQAPGTMDQETRAYLNRMFLKVQIALNQSDLFPVRHSIPERLEEGRLYYFGSAINGEVHTSGFWRWDTEQGWSYVG